MIRLKLNNNAEQICQNADKFDPREIIKPARISALRAFGVDGKALSVEYQDKEGKISNIELIKIENKEGLIPKSVQEREEIKRLKSLFKKEGILTKNKEVIVRFE